METKPTYEELEQKIENLRKRIKDQNIGLERASKLKDVMFKSYQILSESKYNGTKDVSEACELLKTTLFGLSKKKGGTRSKFTIMKAIEKKKKNTHKK